MIVPKRFVSIGPRKSAIGVSSTDERLPYPALLITTSSEPKAPIAAFTALAAADSSVTSSAKSLIWSPCRSDRSASDLMSRAVANTLFPAARPASTIARPRLRELPVTNHTCAIHPPLSSQPRIFWRSFSNSGLDAQPEKELISDPFIDFPSQSRAAARCLVVEPLIDCLDLFFRERRKQVVDRHVRQRYQDRFGVRERVVSRFS